MEHPEHADLTADKPGIAGKLLECGGGTAKMDGAQTGSIAGQTEAAQNLANLLEAQDHGRFFSLVGRR